MPMLDYFVGGGSATVILSAIGAVGAKYLKHATANLVADMLSLAVKDIKKDLQTVQLTLAKETGGNSNGLRQKVNEIAGKVEAVALDVAHLKGKLEGAEGAKG